MELVKWLALKFDEDGIDWTQWPKGVTAEQNNCEVLFEGWEVPSTTWKGEPCMDNLGWECDGDFKYIEEYGNGQSCERSEFEDFITKNPTFVQDVKAEREGALKEIAQLNRQAYESVEKAMALAAEVCVPYSCRMPAGVADLDQNSDWDSSRC